MWLLENSGDDFEGRQLWLRPGKRYLFGRTASEPGQLAISDKTISRKHLTIEVDKVKEGDGLDRHARTSVTIEDLKAKQGTLVNGTNIKGQKIVVNTDSEIKMGLCPRIFRLTWHNVTFSFSFTSRELREDPWARLRDQLEQLDIKFIGDYDIALTTHVVTKRRNTSKGLQALINGKYIVSETFITAVLDAAAAPPNSNEFEPSPLERDFVGNWPKPMEHLPPRGEEPTDRSDDAYAPDNRRQEIFDGYTYIFYEKKQYDNLVQPIENGKGKALMREVVPNETQTDDFVRYVKEVAGEKGLGEFEDGSEGKGVVVVRYVPKDGDASDWYINFTTTVALRLDHRLIDQREFLDAILAAQPGMLRRPLEVEDGTTSSAMDVDRFVVASDAEARAASALEPMDEEPPPPPPPPARKGKGRRAASRFKGFDAEPDVVDLVSEPLQDRGMFVSQSEELGAGSSTTRTSQRKRPAAIIEEDVMEVIIPTAAANKRRRIAAGEDPVPRAPTPEPEPVDEDVIPESPPAAAAETQKGKKKKINGGDILELAKQRREAAEKRAAEERERLAHVPEDGIDFVEIRNLTIVEEFEVRQVPEARTREQDIADGRWDPRWNGRRNFKKFRKQGDPTRPVQRVIVGLEAVKTKEYGIGDDYWLEDSGPKQKSKNSQTQSQSQGLQESQPRPGPKAKGKAPARPSTRQVIEDDSDDSIEDDEPDPEPEPSPEPERDLPRTKVAKKAQKATTRASQVQSQRGKRVASATVASEKPAKRPRRGVAKDSDASDDDDGLAFKFGKR